MHANFGWELKSCYTILEMFVVACMCSVASDCLRPHGLWTVVHWASLSVEFSRPEYWSRLPFPTLGELPDPGINPASLVSPALAGGFLTLSHQGMSVIIKSWGVVLIRKEQYKIVTYKEVPSLWSCSLTALFACHILCFSFGTLQKAKWHFLSGSISKNPNHSLICV